MLIVTALIAVASGMPMTDAGNTRNVTPVCEQAGPHPAGKLDDLPMFQGNRDHTLITGVRELGKEPASDGYSAVLYTEGRCSRPLVVSRNLGMNPKTK